jgi:signal transduction histidine kinase
MNDDIPVCIIQLDKEDKIVGFNKCLKKEISMMIPPCELDYTIGKDIRDIIPSYKKDLYKEPIEFFIKGVKIKCSLSVSVNNNLVYLEIFHCTKRFLDFIGYEFRTPISVAVEMASLLSNTSSKNQSKYISALKENNIRLTNLLVNTIDYLKLLTYNIEYSKEMTSLESIFGIVKNKTVNKNKNITINYDITGNIKVYIDKQRFVEMIIHLLNYFLNRMERGFINIKSTISSDNKEVYIYFTDTGRKIYPDDIFSGFIDKDYVIDSSSLELPISKGLALGMGGNLLLENTSDYGNTFKFIFKSQIS